LVRVGIGKDQTKGITLSALAVDGGYLYVMKSKLQRTADAAALAAASLGLTLWTLRTVDRRRARKRQRAHDEFRLTNL